MTLSHMESVQELASPYEINRLYAAASGLFTVFSAAKRDIRVKVVPGQDIQVGNKRRAVLEEVIALPLDDTTLTISRQRLSKSDNHSAIDPEMPARLDVPARFIETSGGTYEVPANNIYRTPVYIVVKDKTGKYLNDFLIEESGYIAPGETMEAVAIDLERSGEDKYMYQRDAVALTDKLAYLTPLSPQIARTT